MSCIWVNEKQLSKIAKLSVMVARNLVFILKTAVAFARVSSWQGNGEEVLLESKILYYKELKKINETETSSIKIFEIFNAIQVFEDNN